MQTLHKYTGASPVLHWDTGALPSIGKVKPAPIQVGDLLYWFSANACTVNGSNQVTGLTDLSGNGNAVTVTGTPAYTASDADFNNLPSIGNTTGQRYEFSSINKTSTLGGWTFMYVIKPTSNTGTPTLFDTQSGRMVNYSFNSSRYAYFDGSLRTVGTQVPDTNLHILTFVLNSDTNVGEIFLDGVSLGTNTYTLRAIANATALFGRPNALGGGLSYIGRWAQALCWSKPLTTAQRQQVEGSFNYS